MQLTCMLQYGNWGSDLEALAAAELYQVPVFNLSNRSKAHGFLMNHGVHTANILHLGNHYDALLPLCRLFNCRQPTLWQTLLVSSKQREAHYPILDSPILKPMQHKKQNSATRKTPNPPAVTHATTQIRQMSLKKR
jgi:hypothetical protein